MAIRKAAALRLSSILPVCKVEIESLLPKEHPAQGPFSGPASVGIFVRATVLAISFQREMTPVHQVLLAGNVVVVEQLLDTWM